MTEKKIIWNPYMPFEEHVPDGEPRVFGDRLYIYGSHDSNHGKEFCTEDYVCWSAPVNDLTDWKYEGVIYRKDQDPLNPEGAQSMYAPDCVKGPDGRFYLYYGLSKATQVSVAVCDTPAGKYQYLGCVGKCDADGNYLVMENPLPFDPGVLVDGDKVYLYCGFCPGSQDRKFPMLANDRGGYVVELEKDMVTQKTEPKYLIPSLYSAADTSFAGHPFFEASSVRKINDKFYFIYSSILSHELCYATSDYPDRDFVFGGTIVSNGDIGLNGRKSWERVAYTGNTHGSIANINGEWYVFYHRHTEAIRCCRQACAERIQLREDGFIPQVEITSQGLFGRPLPTGRTYPAAICCNMVQEPSAFHIEGSGNFRDEIPYVIEEDGDGIVEHIGSDTHLGYKYFDFDGTEDEIKVTIRGNGKGKLYFYTGGSSLEWLTGDIGVKIAECSIELSDSAWKQYTSRMDKTEGVKSFFIRYVGEGTISFHSFAIM